jgi:hypothetical protein
VRFAGYKTISLLRKKTSMDQTIIRVTNEQLSATAADLGHGFSIGPLFYPPGRTGIHWYEVTFRSRGSVWCEVAWPAPHAPIRITQNELSGGDVPQTGGVFVICLADSTAAQIEAAAEPYVDRVSNE